MTNSVKYLPYSLTLNAPAIVTTLSGDPNSAATQMFIPGNAVRGALAARLLKNGLSAESHDFRALILGGGVHYLHAYPAHHSTRSLPTPLGWRCEKGLPCGAAARASGAFDLAAFSAAVNDDTTWDDDLTIEPDDVWPAPPLDRKGIRPFVAFAGAATLLVQPHRDARMHQQRDRDAGRSWTERKSNREIPHGTPFVYEYLQPHQCFRGVIRVSAPTVAEVDSLSGGIKRTLDGQTILVGRSQRAGYGGAAAIGFEAEQTHEAEWGGVQRSDVPAGDMFRAYLLSACVVRDPATGQFDPCALPDLIVERLGGPEAVRVERTLHDFETVGGFNRKWRLETPQAFAVKAGSCFVLRALRGVSRAHLKEVVDAGFGERRVEGFGRLAFLEGSGHRSIRVQPGEEQPANKTSIIGQAAPELVRFLQRRILDAAVSRALDRKVTEILTGGKTIAPSASLLGRLRIPLRSGDPENGLQTLRQWLRDADPKDRAVLKEEAQDKLKGCVLAKDKSLHKWLVETASDGAGAKWAADVARGSPQLGAPSLVEEIAKERGASYAVRLIDGVLAALARKVRQESREDG